MRPLVALLFGMAVAAACSSTTGSAPVGTACATDAECGSGPKCVTFYQPTDAGCTSLQQCWYPCTTDSDCVGATRGTFSTPKCITGSNGCPPATGTCGTAM